VFALLLAVVHQAFSTKGMPAFSPVVKMVLFQLIIEVYNSIYCCVGGGALPFPISILPTLESPAPPQSQSLKGSLEQYKLDEVPE
jgi:hypothetical protein